MGNSGSSGGANRKARSLPNSPEAHRYRSRFNFSFSAFLRPSSRPPSENRLFRLQIFESSTRLPFIFLREFRADDKQSSFSNASKYLDSSFRFDLMHDASSRLYRLRILVCGLNFHGDYFVLFVEAYSPRSRRNLVIFCLVVSTLKCRLLNVLLVIFIEKLIESRI